MVQHSQSFLLASKDKTEARQQYKSTEYIDKVKMAVPAAGQDVGGWQ